MRPLLVSLAATAAAVLLAFALMYDSTWRPALLGVGVVVLIAASYFSAEAVLLYRRRHPRSPENERFENEEEP